MVQRVVYGALPNTPDAAVMPKVAMILGYVERENPGFKDLRNFLREQNLWHKEDTPAVLDLLGIGDQDPVRLGPVASKLSKAASDEDQKKILFERMLEQNQLLAKYVLEALDVESGGRLHSTHELYRLITSYVYPGTYITLPNFQNWIKWMSIGNAIRVIGIRWGLADAGKQILPKLRNLDVEEFLEEEKEGSGAPEEPAAAVKPAPAVAATPTPAVESKSATARKGGPEDEELPDMPPEPDLPDPLAVAAAEAALAVELVEEPAAPSAKRSDSAGGAAEAIEPLAEPTLSVAGRPVRMVAALPPPLSAGGPVSPQPAEISADQLRDNDSRIAAWWSKYPHKQVLHAADFDLSPKDFDTDRQVFMLQLLTLSVLLDHERYQAPIQEFFARLQGVSFFRRFLRQSESIEALLHDVDFFNGNLWHVRLAENLIHMLRFKHMLLANDDPLTKIEGARSTPDMLRRVAGLLFGGAFFIEPFWVVREMVSMGLWEKPMFARATFVPTARARMNAYRLGYLDSLYADGLPALLKVSQTMSEHFGPATDYDGAMRQLDEGFGCQFRCPHVLSCPLNCREKQSL